MGARHPCCCCRGVSPFWGRREGEACRNTPQKRGLPPIPAFGIGWLYPVCPAGYAPRVCRVHQTVKHPSGFPCPLNVSDSIGATPLIDTVPGILASTV